MMTREITTTTVKVAKIEVQDGVPVAVHLPDTELLGDVKMERAQRTLNKQYGESVTITELLVNKVKYEMPVEDFIANATIVVEESV